MAQNNTWQAHIQQVCCWAAAKACCCRVGKITVLVTEWFMSSAWLEDQLWLLWSRTITWFENTWDIYTMGPVYAFIVKQLENICFSPSNFHFFNGHSNLWESCMCVITERSGKPWRNISQGNSSLLSYCNSSETMDSVLLQDSLTTHVSWHTWSP